MCTVTIVPLPTPQGKRWRMACSRDEQHGRDLAQPPQRHTADNGRPYLMPIDPASGGTWVAANDAGLALTLLNYNLPEPPVGRTLSRGSVIPALIGCATLDEICEALPSIDAAQMMPFRLVFTDGRDVYTWRSTQPPTRGQGVECVPLWEPMIWTSSGLGDHLVEKPRRELFDGWFDGDQAQYADRQLAFHQHRWPDRPHLSVAMSREDACTVSYTTVDVSPERVTMRYHPDRPDLPADDVEATLTRRPNSPVSA